jgi:CBS domain-containing protein
MTADPASINENVSLDEAAQLMTRLRLKRLPVVNREGELVGVIARSDILHRIAKEAHLRIETPLLTAIESSDQSLVRGWMRSDIATASPADTLAVVIKRLVAEPLRRVVVIDDERHVVGIVIGRDLSRWVSGMPDAAFQTIVRNWLQGDTSDEHDLLTEISAEDVMLTPVYTVFDDALPIEVIQTMIQRRDKRLVVVDHDNRLKGIIDRHDILRTVSSGRK